MAAMVGIAECTPDTAMERIAGFAAIHVGDAVRLAPTGYVAELGDYMADHDPGAILTSADWPRPAAETGLDGGGYALRLTRAPSSPGLVACILTALYSGDALQDQTMVDIAGDASGNLTVAPGACVRHLGTNGSTLSHVMRLPIWGWDDDPWGLVYLTRLDLADECRRFEDLLNGSEEAHPGEKATLLAGRAGSVMGTGMRDDEYQRFRTLYRQMHGNDAHEECRTAERQAEHGRRVEAVVRRMRLAA